MQLPASRTDRETMSEHEEDTEEEEEEEAYRGGPSAYAGPSGGTGTGRRHDRSATQPGRVPVGLCGMSI